MSDQRGASLRVGALLFATLIISIGLTFYLSGSRNRHGRAFETYFRESVQGLEVGAPVKYSGVTIGQVTFLGLVTAVYGDGRPDLTQDPNYRLVVVRFVVNPRRIGEMTDTPDLIAQGLRARLGLQGLTGLSYLEMQFEPPGRYPPIRVPWQPRNDYIPSVPSTIAQVQDAAQILLSRLSQIDFAMLASEATSLVTDLRRELREQGDVHMTLATLRDTLGDLRDTLAAAELPQLTAQLHRTAAGLDELVRGRQVHDVLGKADLALARLTALEQQLPGLITALHATVSRADNGAADLQAELSPLLQDARVSVQNLREASELLRRDPAQMLLGGPPPHRVGGE